MKSIFQAVLSTTIYSLIIFFFRVLSLTKNQDRTGVHYRAKDYADAIQSRVVQQKIEAFWLSCCGHFEHYAIQGKKGTDISFFAQQNILLGYVSIEHADCEKMYSRTSRSSYPA